MRNTGFFWWVGALLAAVMAGFLTYSLLKPVAPVINAAPVITRPVVVAATNIPLRRSITAEDLVVRELPADSAPESAAVTAGQVVGKMSTVDLFANEPILLQQLITPDVVTQQVALSIPRGKIVVAVPTDSTLIANSLVRPGDHIDLLATVELAVTQAQGSTAMPKTLALLQNLEIHAIILPAVLVDGGTPPEPQAQPEQGGVFQTLDENGQAVLLAIDAQDALTIRHILDVGGMLDLALRAPNDDSALNPAVVDQSYLAGRYQIDLTR
jgi:pilus assembly protein CpaB